MHTQNIRLHDRTNKLGFMLVFDEKGRGIGKAKLQKVFLCPLTKRSKLSINVYSYTEFGGYFSGQIFADDLTGWIKNKITKFN